MLRVHEFKMSLSGLWSRTGPDMKLIRHISCTILFWISWHVSLKWSISCLVFCKSNLLLINYGQQSQSKDMLYKFGIALIDIVCFVRLFMIG
jgi:hypothetical protein